MVATTHIGGSCHFGLGSQVPRADPRRLRRVPRASAATARSPCPGAPSPPRDQDPARGHCDGARHGAGEGEGHETGVRSETRRQGHSAAIVADVQRDAAVIRASAVVPPTRMGPKPQIGSQGRYSRACPGRALTFDGSLVGAGTDGDGRSAPWKRQRSHSDAPAYPSKGRNLRVPVRANRSRSRLREPIRPAQRRRSHRRGVDLRGRPGRGARHRNRHPEPAVTPSALRVRRRPCRASRCTEPRPRSL